MTGKVICINDKKLPLGAELVEGREYVIVEKFKNTYDQIAYIIEGVENEGRTRFGIEWIGYSADRFANLDETYEEAKEVNFAVN